MDVEIEGDPEAEAEIEEKSSEKQQVKKPNRMKGQDEFYSDSEPEN